jgi:hypothetical protein
MDNNILENLTPKIKAQNRLRLHYRRRLSHQILLCNVGEELLEMRFG